MNQRFITLDEYMIYYMYYVYVYIFMHICIYLYIYIYIYVYNAYTYIYTCLKSSQIFEIVDCLALSRQCDCVVHTCSIDFMSCVICHLCMCIYIYIYIHAYTYVYTYVCICIYMYMNMYTCIMQRHISRYASNLFKFAKEFELLAVVYSYTSDNHLGPRSCLRFSSYLY